jgi:basic membrane lipoprotein Med (substrate-binding protein (PBP1-ABC) superfamily)
MNSTAPTTYRFVLRIKFINMLGENIMRMAFHRFGFFALILVLLAAGCAPAATPTPAPTAAAAQPFRIAVIQPSPNNDQSWDQTMYNSLTQLQQEMGKENLDVAYSENMYNVPDAAAAIRDYATKGYDLIIANGAQYGTSLQQIAPDFPKTSFAWGTSQDTFQEDGINNIFAYQPDAEQGGYVLGTMAAMMSKSGIIGLVGPIKAGDAVLYADGFTQGAQAAKPGTKVNVVYTGSFTDVTLSATAANTFLQDGADILTGSAQQDVGALGVAKDKSIPWFSADWCQISLAPNDVVACQQYDWTSVLKDMITSHKAGVMGGKAYQLTLANAGLSIIYNDKVTIPADVKSAAETAIQGIKDGKIKVNP